MGRSGNSEKGNGGDGGGGEEERKWGKGIKEKGWESKMGSVKDQGATRGKRLAVRERRTAGGRARVLGSPTQRLCPASGCGEPQEVRRSLPLVDRSAERWRGVREPRGRFKDKGAPCAGRPSHSSPLR